MKPLSKISLVLAFLSLLLTPPLQGFSVFLPDVSCSPPLPYAAEADHYSGPASVQMLLNTCPDIIERNYHDQHSLYAKILLHNGEPATWFSDPRGIEKSLEDPALMPCGNWVDYSNTDKYYILGKMLYYMRTQRYMTPVSVGSNEHWVTVCGYHTDTVPPYSGPVTLHNIFFYDPLPGNPSTGWVSGTIWLSESSYWGVPHNRPGSAWHGKYIAIIEPPEPTISIIILKWPIEGRIIPERMVRRSFQQWLSNVRERKLAFGPFTMLYKDTRMEKPILVKAENYSYYFIPLKNRRLAAVFNAYDGSFEEIRCFQRDQKSVLDPETIRGILEKTLSTYEVEIVEMSKPELVYRTGLTPVGRCSPSWKVEVLAKDTERKPYRLHIYTDTEGEIIKGLEDLKGIGKEEGCIDFEDPLLGTTYHVGTTFLDSGTEITNYPFQWSNLGWTAGGYSKVENLGLAGASDQEMMVNNVNLGFDFKQPLNGLSLNFGEYGGNLNIGINGDFKNFEDFIDVHGSTIGGVNLKVINGMGKEKGRLELTGTIERSRFILGEIEVESFFIIGGQELFIDHVCKK